MGTGPYLAVTGTLLSRLGQAALALSLIVSIAAAAIMATLVFGGPLPPFMRPPITDADFSPPKVESWSLAFRDLKGWRSDNQSEAIPAFLRSCERIAQLADDASVNSAEYLDPAPGEPGLFGVAGDWREACAAARAFRTTRYADALAAASAARAVFEFYFRPIKLVRRRSPLPHGPARNLPDRVDSRDLITGYFEPVYQASTFKTRERSAPVLRRPDDLVTVDLGAFRQELTGERIAGFVEDGVLKPYPDHHAINRGALRNASDPIAWVDPNDLFFLQIQGSGRLRLQNGRELRVGFDGHNGQPYTAIGRILIERGVLTPETVSMQAIREWLEKAPPKEAQALREANQSYVFFRVLDDLPDPKLGPFGANGVQLTPARSIAVDRRYYALGAPMWLAVPPVEGRTPEIYRLLVAQDTGGAVKGPLRGDIFLGSGARAGEAAGRFRAEGDMIVLAPRAAVARLDAAGLIVHSQQDR